MPVATARQPAAGRAAPKAAPAADPQVVIAYISLTPPAPIVYPPSSRTIARLKAKAEEAVRNAAAAQALARQVQPALRPPAGRLFAVDAAALLLRGPLGGIGSTERMVRTLGPLAGGGRHLPAVLVAAGGWSGEDALREALVGIGGKLAALGLRIDRRKAGIRMAKVKTA
ncbi:hypothetical protein MKK84_06955 [Methylobacterium sp. E-065]|uniref:hypothetical protein n=1 Tax=Methylobacterium sp. E-065 TaxID=2836583 RepID=UPI001FBA9B5C|nr:hypothetical protein [Methylobacterium sp. E-065]MCJ2017162.1 hypothetical protein [Methylobacterium sp. E-065]